MRKHKRTLAPRVLPSLFLAQHRKYYIYKKSNASNGKEGITSLSYGAKNIESYICCTRETRRLNEQVKRNANRFPKDFMFTLTEREYENLKSQNATSSWGGRRKLPNAFTEQGVAMLSSVLNSDIAIEVNIRIIRVFTKMKEYALTHKEILLQLAKLEKEVKGNSSDIENIFMVLKELLEKQSKANPPRNKIGFKQYD